MQESKTATLTEIFSDVLADLAFMSTHDEEVVSDAEARWLETSISYGGPTSGTLRLRCTKDFSVLLAANLLGAEAGVEAKASDAVKEFMNIFCGQFVTAMYGTEEVYNLTIPRIEELPEAPELREDSGLESAVLSVAGHQVQVSCLSGGELGER